MKRPAVEIFYSSRSKQNQEGKQETVSTNREKRKREDNSPTWTESAKPAVVFFHWYRGASGSTACSREGCGQQDTSRANEIMRGCSAGRQYGRYILFIFVFRACKGSVITKHGVNEAGRPTDRPTGQSVDERNVRAADYICNFSKGTKVTVYPTGWNTNDFPTANEIIRGF